MGQWQNSYGVTDTCRRWSLSPTAFCVAYVVVGTRGIAQFHNYGSLEMSYTCFQQLTLLFFGMYVPLRAGFTVRYVRYIPNNDVLLS